MKRLADSLHDCTAEGEEGGRGCYDEDENWRCNFMARGRRGLVCLIDVISIPGSRCKNNAEANGEAVLHGHSIPNTLRASRVRRAEPQSQVCSQSKPSV